MTQQITDAIIKSWGVMIYNIIVAGIDPMPVRNLCIRPLYSSAFIIVFERHAATPYTLGTFIVSSPFVPHS